MIALRPVGIHDASLDENYESQTFDYTQEPSARRDKPREHVDDVRPLHLGSERRKNITHTVLVYH